MNDTTNYFGVSTILFRELPLEKALEKISKTKLKLIDLTIVLPKFCPHYNPLNTNSEDDKKLKELIESYELKVSTLNVSPGFYNKDNPDLVTKFLKRSIEISELLNANSITMPSGLKVSDDIWIENVKIVKKYLTEIAKIANDSGVLISVETPHFNTLTETIEQAKKFHEIIDYDTIKCTFDTSHVTRGENNTLLEGLDKIGLNKINHIHLRDSIGEDISLTPGKGHGNFVELFNYLKSRNYKGHYIFELEYNDYSEKKKLSELEFAYQYCTEIYNNRKLSKILKIKTNKFNLFIERFRHNPKKEIQKKENLFKFLKKFKPFIIKISPDVVYEGKWKKKYRFIRAKNVNVNYKPTSIEIEENPEKICKIGIIGCGWAGTEMHAPGFHRLNNTEIIGGFDIDKDKTKKFAQKFNCKAYGTVEDMVKYGKPDIVSICSTEWAHYESAVYLLRNGVDVFTEKLMATRYSHAKEMVETAKQYNRVLAVNYNYRFIPGIAKIKEVIEQKPLGKLSFFNINVHAMSYAHAIDLLTYLGGKIKTVSGTFQNDDKIRIFGNTDWSLYDEDILYVPSINASVTCEFENGAVGVINSSYYYYLYAFVLSIETVFEQGAITLNGINMFDIIGKLSYYKKGFLNSKIKTIDINHKKGVYTKGYEYTFFNSIEYFMRKYINNRKSMTPGEQGLFNIELEKAIYKSNKEKTKINLSDFINP